eukprot:GHVT01059566.1.p2 GENE.GHVT01059566.1~~GHVT01059566.1.p2  ORF type:complete len:109 (-),score=12.95 GHVT01059566.1:273-599(-)
MTVELAKGQDRSNPVAAGILRYSGSRFPGRTARTLIQQACPELVRVSTSAITMTTPTAPPPAAARPAGATRTAPTLMDVTTATPPGTRRADEPQPGPSTLGPEGEGEP